MENTKNLSQLVCPLYRPCNITECPEPLHNIHYCNTMLEYSGRALDAHDDVSTEIEISRTYTATIDSWPTYISW